MIGENMRYLLALVSLLCLSSAPKLRGQETPPLNLNVPVRRVLYGGEAITPGFVWAPGKDENHKPVWRQKPVGSCEFCAQPMTWKRAAFDKKALLLMAIPIAGRIADTEYTFSMPCMKARTCREGNPLLGGTRAQQYAVGFGIVAGVWVLNSWLRKGDLRINAGGWKHWYLIPIEYGAANAIGIILNRTNLHRF